jgi:hypothetical protein
MPLSAQKTVAAAGTAEALGSAQVNAAVMVKALASNTGTIYIGNDGAGDVSSSNGLPLIAGDVVIFDFVGNLASVMIDSTVNGEGVAYLVLDA